MTSKGLRIFAALVALVETLLYSTLPPLLPGLASELGLSQAGAGLLGAAYPAGMALATVPAGLLADRIDPRFAARIGVAVLALSSTAFAFAASVWVIDLARLLQGAAGAAAWAGALAALVAVSTTDRRGAELGFVVSAAFVGTAFGPVLGVLADVGGREVVFVPMAVGLVVLAVWGGPRTARPKAGPRVRLLHLVGEGRMFGSLTVMVVDGVLLGGVQVLGALFLAERGATAGLIAIVFVSAYVGAATITPVVARDVDRRGPGPATVVTFLLTGTALILTPSVSAIWAASILLMLGTAAAACAYSSVMVRISQVADLRQLPQGLSMALANGSWGIGAAVGAVVLTVVAEGPGDVAAFALVTALSTVGLIGLSWSNADR